MIWDFDSMMLTFPTTTMVPTEQVVRCLANKFEPISLNEMEHVSLLRRVDTKYLLSTMHLYGILAYLTESYRVLSVNQVRLNRYETLYFDTPDFMFYKKHHNGKLNRYKIRCRRYMSSNLSFLEIKCKNNKKKTIKKRVAITDITSDFDRKAAEFIRTHSPVEAYQLEPKLWTNFLRLTLVSKTRRERLTIDINLEFCFDDQRVHLPNIAIAEVKQEKFSLESDFIRQMRALKIRPTSFSKYAMATATLYPDLKQNNFKPTFLQLEKIAARNLNGRFT